MFEPGRADWTLAQLDCAQEIARVYRHTHTRVLSVSCVSAEEGALAVLSLVPVPITPWPLVHQLYRVPRSLSPLAALCSLFACLPGASCRWPSILGRREANYS